MRDGSPCEDEPFEAELPSSSPRTQNPLGGTFPPQRTLLTVADSGVRSTVWRVGDVLQANPLGWVLTFDLRPGEQMDVVGRLECFDVWEGGPAGEGAG